MAIIRSLLFVLCLTMGIYHPMPAGHLHSLLHEEVGEPHSHPVPSESASQSGLRTQISEVAPTPPSEKPAASSASILNRSITEANPNVSEKRSLLFSVLLPSAPNDHSWSQSLIDSLQNVSAAMKVDLDIYLDVEAGITRPSRVLSRLEEMLKENPDIVIAHAHIYRDIIIALAEKYPMVQFVVGPATSTAVKSPPNVVEYQIAVEEAGYLNGVIAALEIDIPIMGVVSAEDPENSYANRYINGLRNGLMQISPAAEMNVSYVKSPWHVHHAAESSAWLLLNDVQVLTGSQPQSIGSLHTAADNDIKWLGLAVDQKSLGPNSVIASQVFSFENMIRDIIRLRSAGTQPSVPYTLNFKNGGIRTVYNPAIRTNHGLEQSVQKVTEAIKEGYLKPLDSKI